MIFFIIIKHNSLRIKKKNFKKVGNKQLWQNLIHNLKGEKIFVDTDSKKIYEISKILRSHGMVREAKNRIFEKKMINKYKTLSPKFIFLYPTLNFRNNEIGAIIGINQLKNLNKNNQKRKNNFSLFFKKFKKI